MTVTDVYQPETRAAPNTYPVPAGRGRWRLTLHTRIFDQAISWQNSLLSELPTAFNRKLTQAWGTIATATFNLDGWSSAAALIAELQQDVVWWRWDDTRGVDEPMFRGCITASEDDLDEQSHTVVFTANDHLALLNRRFAPINLTYNNVDQDDIVAGLTTQATTAMTTMSGQQLTPGSVMPMAVTLVNPDGSIRSAKSGTLRIRNYLAQQNLYTALSDLSLVIGGFDYDLTPGWRFGTDAVNDWLRVFFPQQGVTRSDLVLYYPGNLAQVKRQVNSSDYANYVRVLGNNQSSSASTAQLASEAMVLADAQGRNVGLWMDPEQAADVIDQPTLDQKAAGYINTLGVLQPTYTLTLAPNTYHSGLFYMGDVVPLIIQSGRLNVNTQVRILGIEYDIGDDGNENVILVVGRPTSTFFNLMTKQRRDVEALARR